MRITCPNCDAQYEVDERAIPESGRDVQCSNCGHAWFQLPPSVEEAVEDEAASFGDAEPTPPAEAGPATGAGSEAAAGRWAEREAEAEPEEGPLGEAAGAPRVPGTSEAEVWPVPPAGDESEYEEEAEPPPAAEPAEPAAFAEPQEAEDEITPRLTPAPQRRPLDENIQAVLREEAERERQARQGDSGAAQEPAAPPEPAAAPKAEPAAATPSVSPRRPLAPATPEPEEAAAEEAAETEREEETAEEDDLGVVSQGARRDLLPDIEQINSTLTAGNEQGAAAVAMAPPPKRRNRAGGFRLGFRLILLVVVLGLVLYVLAPSIAGRVPATAPILNAYIALIDSYRDWLNRLLLSAVAQMNH